MGVFIGVSGMATQTLPGAGPHGLELSRGQAQLMDVMTRRARDAFLGMYGLLPIIVFPMMAIQGLVGVKLCLVFFNVSSGLLLRNDGPAGAKAHRPIDAFGFECLAAAVAAAADLGADARR